MQEVLPPIARISPAQTSLPPANRDCGLAGRSRHDRADRKGSSHGRPLLDLRASPVVACMVHTSSVAPPQPLGVDLCHLTDPRPLLPLIRRKTNARSTGAPPKGAVARSRTSWAASAGLAGRDGRPHRDHLWVVRVPPPGSRPPSVMPAGSSTRSTSSSVISPISRTASFRVLPVSYALFDT